MQTYKLLLPFSAIAVTFILLGIILNDIHHVYFGIIWLVTAAIVFTIKKFKHTNR